DLCSSSGAHTLMTGSRSPEDEDTTTIGGGRRPYAFSDALCSGRVSAGGQAGGSAQRGAGARRVGGRLQLDRGHLATSGCRLARDRAAKSTDITRRFCRCSHLWICNTDDKQNAKVNRAHPPRVHGG